MALVALFLSALARLLVIDRDEARFVRSSSQMVQSGDPVDIQFRDQPRLKKPAGHHWLQASAAALSGQGDQQPFWVYRLASLGGAIVSVLLVAAFAESGLARANLLCCWVGDVALLRALTGAALMIGLFPSLGRLPVIWPGDWAFQAAMASAKGQGCLSPGVVGWGHYEPSLVWLAGAGPELIPATEGLPDQIASEPCSFVLREVLPDQLPPLATCPSIATVPGFALGAGHWLTLDAFSRGKSE